MSEEDTNTDTTTPNTDNDTKNTNTNDKESSERGTKRKISFEHEPHPAKIIKKDMKQIYGMFKGSFFLKCKRIFFTTSDKTILHENTSPLILLSEHTLNILMKNARTSSMKQRQDKIEDEDADSDDVQSRMSFCIICNEKRSIEKLNACGYCGRYTCDR
jgi:hypothetical protein